jgi:hypothetical protein
MAAKGAEQIRVRYAVTRLFGSLSAFWNDERKGATMTEPAEPTLPVETSLDDEPVEVGSDTGAVGATEGDLTTPDNPPRDAAGNPTR